MVFIIISTATVISWMKGLSLVNPKTIVELILHVDTIWIASQNNGGPTVGKSFPKSDKEEGETKIFIWYLKPEENGELPDEIRDQTAHLDIFVTTFVKSLCLYFTIC